MRESSVENFLLAFKVTNWKLCLNMNVYCILYSLYRTFWTQDIYIYILGQGQGRIDIFAFMDLPICPYVTMLPSDISSKYASPPLSQHYASTFLKCNHPFQSYSHCQKTLTNICCMDFIEATLADKDTNSIPAHLGSVWMM